MIKIRYRLLLVSVIAFGGLITTSQVAPKTKKHNIQLQLADSLGFPILGSEFWVTLVVIRESLEEDKALVTLLIPLIDFQTQAAPSPENPIGPGLVPGGYLYTSDGFLSRKNRPFVLVPPSIVAASNNGQSPVFSFTQDPETLPNPPAGYIVQVTNAGELQVQAAGTFGNIIAPGPQILMPCSISYLSKGSTKKLSKNTKISTGVTNITQFTNKAANNGIRDSHVNDALNGVVAFSWTSNSGNVHLNNGTMNTMVAIGKVKNGELKMHAQINLTNYPDNVLTPTNQGIEAWTTSVAINRTNPNNIVVSWGKIDRSNSPNEIALPYRAVSFDGGKTWPINGLMDVPPTGNPAQFGDCLGVSSDKFGNIWYSTTNRFDGSGNQINQPYFAVSTDGGVTFTLAYTAPAIDPSLGFTDYPQYCFGGDGFGNYGLWFQTNIYLNDGDAYPNVGFIQIPGPLTPSDFPLTSNFTDLFGLNNSITEGDLAASSDGRVWFQGFPNAFGASSYIQPQSISFKSPGAIDENWSGSWNYLNSNDISGTYGTSSAIPSPIAISYPLIGFFANATLGIVYDEQRQALYAIAVEPNPNYSQSYNIPLIISRDNGMTWSDPIRINTSHSGNRGYQSMALDTVTGDLVFGFYDGRNDPTLQTLEYFGAVLSAKKLDKLVKKIPLSNPTFVVPSAA